MLGQPRCLTFGCARVEAAMARELLRAVEPMAIEAALEAERMYMESQTEQRRIIELELQQARKQRAKFSGPSIGGAASTRSCGCANQSRESTAAARRTKRWL
jgi:hypothetical protein